MGIFPLPPLDVALVNTISVKSNPWVIPPPDQVDSWGDVMPLRPTKINYVDIVSASASVSTDHTNLSTSLDAYSQSPCLSSSYSSDPLIDTFPTNESIMEIMSLDEAPWNDTHHRSSFLPSLEVMFICLERFSSRFLTQPLYMHIMTHEFWSEGNMGNITQTMPIGISVKHSILEHIHIGVNCSPYEIKLYTRLFQ